MRQHMESPIRVTPMMAKSRALTTLRTSLAHTTSPWSSMRCTVQRMELQGLVVCARLVLRVVNALDFAIMGVTLIGDSMCCLMALRSDGVHFNPYFQHRLCEVQEHLDALSSLVEVVHPVHWVESALNPADLLTKPGARPEHLGPGGFWQAGPSFLLQAKESWPVCVPDEEGAIPAKEVQAGAGGGAAGGPPSLSPCDSCTPPHPAPSGEA